MTGWLKLVGRSYWQLPEVWAGDRDDLLREVRFSEVHPPDPISRGDRLVYHAVGHQRLVAVVEVVAYEPLVDEHPSEWEKQWPLILPIRPLVRVSRVSKSPASNLLGDLPDRTHQGFVPLKDEQLRLAEQLIAEAATQS